MFTVRRSKTIAGDFSARIRAMIHYGTFDARKVRQMEKLKRAFLKSSRGAGPKLSKIQRLRLTEYLLISGELYGTAGVPEDLANATEKFRGLIPEIYDIRYNKRLSSGLRSHGMFSPTCYGLWQKNVQDAINPLHKRSLLEVGPGYSFGSILFAENNPESFVVAVEANALNLLGAYGLLNERKLIEKPLPNLRLLLGDISKLRPPADFRADLVVVQFFNVAGPTLTQEDRQVCEGILRWMDRDAKIVVYPTNLKLTTELALRRLPVYD